MKVLVVFAHPEEKSFNGSLRDVLIAELKAQGHEVKESDLYKMKWKSQIDRDDFPAYDSEMPLQVVSASQKGFKDKTLTDDVLKEQEKLIWADLLIFQFPLWWFSPPAILKGWVERVFSYGFGYGVGEYNETHWGDRYGEGTFKGKRALVITTAGGSESHYTERGVNGPIEDILVLVNRNILFYAGYDVLPPFVVYSAGRGSAGDFAKAADGLRERIRTLETTAPIPYRTQNGGDYEIPSLELKKELVHGRTGFRQHYKD